MSRFPCPYLKGEVELTEERERHITERHPDLVPEYRDRIADTLGDPDQVRRSVRFGNARSFSRWYTGVRRGRYLIVVVVSEADATERHWIVTAYLSTRLAEGVIEWERS
jgi:hypothetical protein